MHRCAAFGRPARRPQQAGGHTCTSDAQHHHQRRPDAPNERGGPAPPQEEQQAPQQRSILEPNLYTEYRSSHPHHCEACVAPGCGCCASQSYCQPQQLPQPAPSRRERHNTACTKYHPMWRQTPTYLPTYVRPLGTLSRLLGDQTYGRVAARTHRAHQCPVPRLWRLYTRFPSLLLLLSYIDPWPGLTPEHKQAATPILGGSGAQPSATLPDAAHIPTFPHANKGTTRRPVRRHMPATQHQRAGYAGGGGSVQG